MGLDPFTILAIGFAAVSLVTSVILSAKAKDAAASLSDADSQTLGDLNVTQQSEGKVVPVIYGCVTLTGNIIWWKAEIFNEEYYRFRMRQSIVMGEVYTNITDLVPDEAFARRHDYSIWEDGKPTWFSDPDYKLSSEDIVSIPIHRIYNGGDSNATPSPGYNIGEFATRLKGICNIVFGIGIGVGGLWISWIKLPQGYTQIPTYKYFLRRNLRVLESLYHLTYIEINVGSGDPNMIFRGNNPAAVMWDLLTDTQYGGGVAATEIDIDNFNAASSYFNTHEMGLNFVLNQTINIRDVITKIQEWTDSYLVKDENNRYAIKILQESDADNPVATIVDDNMIEFTLRRKSWEDTYNSFTANFMPVERVEEGFVRNDVLFNIGWFEYNYINDAKKTVTLKNEANILLTGSERNKVVDLTCFNHINPVSYRLNQIMKKESYPFANATLSTNLRFIHLRPGDVITIDSDEYNISAPFRILNVDYQEIDQNKVKFDLLQMREIVADSNYQSTAYPRGAYQRALYPPCLENVTFPAFSNISNRLTRSFVNDADSIVNWGTGQLVTGELTYGTDYTVQDHNRIVLDPVIFADEILFNANGLLNIDVYELDCPSPPIES